MIERENFSMNESIQREDFISEVVAGDTSRFSFERSPLEGEEEQWERPREYVRQRTENIRDITKLIKGKQVRSSLRFRISAYCMKHG